MYHALLLATILSLGCSEPEDVIVQVLYRPSGCTDIGRYGDTMHVQYLGRFYNNRKKFDSSYDRGNVPFYYQLGIGGVIEGYQIGTKNMCINERRRLIVPSKFAYGERGTGNIPGYSTLMFDVHLVQINDEKPTYPVPLDMTTEVTATGNQSCSNAIKNGDTITITYTGMLPDGRVFDQSTKEGLTFVVGAGQILKGIDEGVVSYCPYTEIQLEIPPAKGYGDEWEHGLVPQWSFMYYTVNVTHHTSHDPVAAADEPTELVCETFRQEKCQFGYKLVEGDYINMAYELMNKRNESVGKGEMRYPIGRKIFCPGWDEVLKGMCVGQGRTCWIPARLAHPKEVSLYSLPPNTGFYTTIKVKELLLTHDLRSEEEVKQTSETPAAVVKSPGLKIVHAEL